VARCPLTLPPRRSQATAQDGRENSLSTGLTPHRQGTSTSPRKITAPFGGGPDPSVSIAALNAPGTSNCAVFVRQYDLVRPRFIPGTADYTAITDGRDPRSYNGAFVWRSRCGRPYAIRSGGSPHVQKQVASGR
jgi:hypothetical protein